MHRLLALRRGLPGRLHPGGGAENQPDQRVSPGERYARIYEINMARCIFCGYCEIACPFDAITLGNDFELSELTRDALVYTKDMLLEPPLRRTPAADPAGVRHGRPGERGRARHVPGLRPEPRRSRAQFVTAAIFYIAGLLALGSAVSVILQRNPFLAAFSLILHFAALAVLYLDLQADFVAAAQVLVYAGGVMILFIFALAYLGERAELDLRRSRFGGWFAVVAGAPRSSSRWPSP